RPRPRGPPPHVAGEVSLPGARSWPGEPASSPPPRTSGRSPPAALLNWGPGSGLGPLEVRHQRDIARRGLLLKHPDQLPAVVPEGVQDLPRIVRQERRHEVLPLLHTLIPPVCYGWS